MKNPIQSLVDHLPSDGSKIIVTTELSKQILAWMRATDVKFNSMEHVEKLYWYLHKNNVITLSYTEVGNDRINFIQRKL